MKISTVGSIGGLLGLALLTSGCAVAPVAPEEAVDPVLTQVTALAAPNQDLATARLLPEDNCYWYEHRGPVETTLLPLRTASGNPICLG